MSSKIIAYNFGLLKKDNFILKGKKGVPGILGDPGQKGLRGDPVSL